jgi:hypothetical protein
VELVVAKSVFIELSFADAASAAVATDTCGRIAGRYSTEHVWERHESPGIAHRECRRSTV